MLDKVNAVVDQIKIFVKKILEIAVPVGGVLIACDLLIGTSFGVLQKAAAMVGTEPMSVVVGLLVIYVVVKK